MEKSTQKLTYSGTTCNSYVYLTLMGDDFDTESVTKALSLTPTKLIRKQDPYPKFTAWEYRIYATNDVDLETPLTQLITLFEDKIEQILQLKTQLNLESRLQFVIDIDIAPDASTPYFGFSHSVIDFLSQTGTTVDFDLYKVDSIGAIPPDAIFG